jgi:hypothetical protein
MTVFLAVDNGSRNPLKLDVGKLYTSTSIMMRKNLVSDVISCCPSYCIFASVVSMNDGTVVYIAQYIPVVPILTKKMLMVPESIGAKKQ